VGGGVDAGSERGLKKKKVEVVGAPLLGAESMMLGEQL